LPVARAVATPLLTGTVPGDFWASLSQCRAELRLIQSEVELRRVLAAACLASMGSRAKVAVPALRIASQDQDESVREAAAAALRIIEGP